MPGTSTGTGPISATTASISRLAAATRSVSSSSCSPITRGLSARYAEQEPVQRRVRTFSHGCMRVRNPVKLAEIILDRRQGLGQGQGRRPHDKGPEENEIALDIRSPCTSPTSRPAPARTAMSKASTTSMAMRSGSRWRFKAAGTRSTRRRTEGIARRRRLRRRRRQPQAQRRRLVRRER